MIDQAFAPAAAAIAARRIPGATLGVVTADGRRWTQVAGLAALALENAITREAVESEEERLRALTQVSIQLCERSVQEHKTLQKERERLETVLLGQNLISIGMAYGL